MRLTRKLHIAIQIVIIISLLACDSNDNYIILKKRVSPDGNCLASVYIYSLGAAAPSGEKVFISNTNETQKDEVFFAYGYDCDIVWINENTIKLIVTKTYNENKYIINTMKEKTGNITIVYEKLISDGFQSAEQWQPK